MAGGEGEQPKSRGSKFRDVVMANLFVVLMIIALVIGVAVGLGVRQLDGWEYYQKRKLFYLKFPGDLLLNMLKMLILPLIVSSLISSLASLDSRASGKMGIRAVVYYLTTTFCAVVLGIIMVLAIRPGEKGNSNIDKTGNTKEQEPLEALFDLIRNCFPDNIVEACFRKQTTKVGTFEYKLPTTATTMSTTVATTMAATTNATNTSVTTMIPSTTTMDPYDTYETDHPKVTKTDGMNVLGIVVFSIFFGAVISRMGPAGRPLLELFEALHIATMKLTMLVIWYSPIGIIFLVATKLIEMEDPGTVFVQLGYYMLTVLVGLGIHGFIVLPLVYFITTRTNPYLFMYRMLKALLAAWGTASSSATLPITMECLELRNKVDIRVAKFVAPIGATVNMDGTALYEAVAAIFIAQVNGISLDVGQVITISLTATAAAIGAAGIPSAGLVTMAIVLTAVGLPVDDIRLIIAIDWFLDRFRTAINVLGDSYGAGIVERLSRDDLERFDLDMEEHGNVPVDTIRHPYKPTTPMDNPTFTDSEKL